MKWREEFKEEVINRRRKNALACCAWIVASTIALSKVIDHAVNYAEAKGALIVMNESMPKPDISEEFVENE